MSELDARKSNCCKGKMWESFLCGLKDWQVLASGLLAGTLASVAIYFSRRQLNYQRGESERVLRRRIRASRALLSNDLDSFIEYLTKCYKIATEIRKGEKKVSTPRTARLPARRTRPPRLPERVLTNLQTLIEHLDKDYKNDAHILIKVASIYQVQNARFRTVLADAHDSRSEREDWEHFKDIGRNVVFLYTLIGNIFPFARDEQEHISLDFSETAAANSFHVLESDLSDDLRLGVSEDEMCAYMVNYVTNQAAKHHFPDYTTASSPRESPAV